MTDSPSSARGSVALLCLCLSAIGCAADPPASKYATAGTSGGGQAGMIAPSGPAGAPSAPAAGSGGSAPTFVPDPSTPVGRHGALRVMGNRILDAAGEPVQLRGMSLFWTQWSAFYLPATIDQLADDWKVSVVRAALGIENAGGYLERPADNEAKVIAVVDRAIARGVYVIIDWHDHHAQDHQAKAVDFFTRMAKKYGNSPAVIFEIFNEPMDVDWPVVKAYAETVLGAIRGAGAKNLVIVGTPNWSQYVDVAAADPITAYPDVAYTLHFYATTHKQWLRTRAQTALDKGAALFVTEWGSCESDGDGVIDLAETNTWLGFMEQNDISWANWALNDKAESCSALAPNTGTKGPWTGSALTQSGMLVKAAIAPP